MTYLEQIKAIKKRLRKGICLKEKTSYHKEEAFLIHAFEVMRDTAIIDVRQAKNSCWNEHSNTGVSYPYFSHIQEWVQDNFNARMFWRSNKECPLCQPGKRIHWEEHQDYWICPHCQNIKWPK
jgi:ribosomal protein S27AE